MKKKVLVVLGPTAVGKTALGIELAQKFNGEIISGDSQQVYRTLDIGTAKATYEEQTAAKHHLLDIRDLTESFSAYDFVKTADQVIQQLLSNEKLPIIVGGTGLYLQALLEGYHLGGQTHHQEMLALRANLSELSDEVLYEKLAQLELRVPELNRRRAIRALELAAFEVPENQQSPYEFLQIGLSAPRERLYERINARVDAMVEDGLLEEAKRLYDQFPQAQAAKGIGYKEFFPYFSGEISYETALELVKRNSRRYAKRQLTWFKNRMAVDFYDVFDAAFPKNIFDRVVTFLNTEKN